MTPAELIRLAIEDRRRLTFSYKGVRRLVEPYVLGDWAGRGPALAAWQLVGDGTGWRVFVLTGIVYVQPTSLVFDGLRPGCAGAGTGFTTVDARAEANG